MNAPILLPTPTEKKTITVITAFVIQSMNITPNVKADIFISLQTENGLTVDTMRLTMEGEDYQQWTQDSYLISWIETQIYNVYPN